MVHCVEVSLAQKRLMFIRAFNSLHGSVEANFSHVVLKIITVKHTQSVFLWMVRWIGATLSLRTHIIKHEVHKTK